MQVMNMMIPFLFVLSVAAAAAGDFNGDPAARTAAWSVDLTPARTEAPLRSVSPAYISFALDNAFVRTDCREIHFPSYGCRCAEPPPLA